MLDLKAVGSSVEESEVALAVLAILSVPLRPEVSLSCM